MLQRGGEWEKWNRNDLTRWEWEGRREDKSLEKIAGVKDLKKSI